MLCAHRMGFDHQKGEIQPGDSVVVFGMGGVGLNAVRAAALSNANPVIAVDIEGSKEAIAESSEQLILLTARRKIRLSASGWKPEGCLWKVWVF